MRIHQASAASAWPAQAMTPVAHHTHRSQKPLVCDSLRKALSGISGLLTYVEQPVGLCNALMLLSLHVLEDVHLIDVDSGESELFAAG